MNNNDDLVTSTLTLANSQFVSKQKDAENALKAIETYTRHAVTLYSHLEDQYPEEIGKIPSNPNAFQRISADARKQIADDLKKIGDLKTKLEQ